MIEDNIRRIAEIILKEKKIMNEFSSLSGYLKKVGNEKEKKLISEHIEKIKVSLKSLNDELLKNLEEIHIEKPLNEIPVNKEIQPVKKPAIKMPSINFKKSSAKDGISEMEKEVLKRLKKKKEKIVEKKIKKPSSYVRLANNFFANYVKMIVKQKRLATLEKDLIKSNLDFTSVTYISILMLSTIISAGIAILIFVFFLFFSVTPELPIITLSTEDIGIRFLKIFWIIFLIPAGTFLFMYFYPSLEKKSVEGKINQELPFATINMSAISGSRIEPIKIFSIISATKEYPHLEKEFNKLLNKINIYGYDLVTALKDSASNCPSQKLAELFNGLATTITSGGDLFDFFDKRSQTLLFEYRLDKEKRTKTSETFMDIYISVVIAAPMILMLLLMMMRISGLGVALSTGTITFLIVGGVSLINIFFLIFLQLKQPEAL
ncbi:MAG: type II secretion system F family protein [Candidatus Pacearchaeota archaeon]|nr:type II secretion system F family protein [Candidatus Pacearchaeota archaeon]